MPIFRIIAGSMLDNYYFYITAYIERLENRILPMIIKIIIYILGFASILCMFGFQSLCENCWVA